MLVHKLNLVQLLFYLSKVFTRAQRRVEVVPVRADDVYCSCRLYELGSPLFLVLHWWEVEQQTSWQVCLSFEELKSRQVETLDDDRQRVSRIEGSLKTSCL